MATTNVNAIFDTLVNSRYPDECYQSSDIMTVFPSGIHAVMQFHLPKLEEVNIASARLFFFVQNRGGGQEISATLCDYHSSLLGMTYNTYTAYVRDTEVLRAQDVYKCSSPSNGFNSWVSIDISNLVVGHLGENYFTLILKGTKLSETNIYGTVINTIEGGHAPYISITYDYATPFKPKILYPNGDAISNSGSLTFRWEYQSGGSSPQLKYDLQWKMQASTNWNNVSEVTANTYYSMDASVFTNGIVEWRVRTYNKYNMFSEWSESQFVVIGKPGNPVISGAKNDAITEIVWVANKSEESAARIRIKKGTSVIYDSGILPAGIEDTHKVDMILDNGNYVALLAISNMYGMWSDEVSYSFTIGRTKPDVPGINISGQGDYVHLEYTAVPAARFFIYRAEGEGEFVAIAETEEPVYDDYAVRSKQRYRYFVRAYDGAYSDSCIEDVYITYKGYFLSCTDDMSMRVNLYQHTGELYVPFEKRSSNKSALLVYAGRRRPVKESGIHTSNIISIEVFVRKSSEEILQQIYRKNGIFCIRSEDILMYCDIASVSSTMQFFNLGYLLGLTFEEVDYQEQVKFNE
ncbi:MAG: hypothetical protein HFG74_08740 [Hungatella sp.]|nr:hypothetical protein [Hungatella sp.]